MGSTGKNVRHVYALDLLFFGRVLAVGMVAFIVVVIFVIVISIGNRAAPCPPCKIVLCSFYSIPFHLYAVVCLLLPLFFVVILRNATTSNLEVPCTMLTI